MPVADAEKDLGRLIRLLGMLGSANDHEVVTAARKAVDWVKDHQTTWALLFDHLAIPPVLGVGVGNDPPRRAPQKPVQAPGGSPPPPGGGTGGTPYSGFLGQPGWQGVAAAILVNHSHVLKGSKELDFVQGRLAKARFPLSPAQENWLRDIAARAGLTW